MSRSAKPKLKKRKMHLDLPADLSQAEAIVESANSTKSVVSEAYQSLQSVNLDDAVQGVPGGPSLNPDEIAVWLIAR